MSSSSSTLNATNVSAIQSDFKESSGKKKPSCRDTGSSGAGMANSGRIKDKKKENHATPMETSDEEAPTIDVIGELEAYLYLLASLIFR